MKAYMPAWSLNCAGANSIHADLVIILLAMIIIYCDDDDEDDDSILTFLPTRSAARLLVRPITAAFVVP